MKPVSEEESATEIVVPALPAPPAREVRLAWRTSSGAAGSITIAEPSLLGSSPSADVTIEDPTVSRVHAELALRADGVWIRDLESRNGTFVDGVRVGAALLEDGARLRLGAVTLNVGIGDARSTDSEWPEARFGRLVGRSAVMRKLFARLDKVAKSDATALALGETGTGKELVAESIHVASPRASRPFVVVDCGAMHASLLESELFGHARGAFTGAVADRSGAFESAAGGTLFLDEVGEIPLELQPKLLRALEARTIRRLGENRARPIDVRIVAATHRDLAKMVADGTFREDLYFRLAVLVVRVPALRERPEDIPALIEHFGGGRELFGAEVLGDLAARRWGGNVRELRNFVERAVAFGSHDEEMTPAPAPSGAGGGDELHSELSLAEARSRYVESFERRYLVELLRRTGYNVTASARHAGIDRTHMHRLLAKYGIARSGGG